MPSFKQSFGARAQARTPILSAGGFGSGDRSLARASPDRAYGTPKLRHLVVASTRCRKIVDQALLRLADRPGPVKLALQAFGGGRRRRPSSAPVAGATAWHRLQPGRLQQVGAGTRRRGRGRASGLRAPA